MGDENIRFRLRTHERLFPVFIYVLSLTLHIVYILEIRKCPLFDYPVLDMYWHRQWASGILSGDLLGSEVFFRAPLYPYFLSLVMAIAGEGFFWPRVFQSAVGSLTPVLVYFLALRQDPSRIWALSAGILAALYPLFFFFDTEFLITVLVLPLDIALVLSLLRLKGRASIIGWTLPGILFGLSAIARPTILPFGAGVIAWIFWSRDESQAGSTLRRAAIFVFACLMIIAPVTIRNWVVGKDFVLISSQGGVNFWIGNNPSASGRMALSVGYQVSMGQYRDSVWLTSEAEAEKDVGRQLKPSEISSYWLKKGLKFVFTKPGQSIPLFMKKIYFLVNGSEIPSNQSIYFYREWSDLLRALLLPGPVKIPFGLLLPFAAAGMFLLIPRRREYMLLYLFLLIYASVVVAFFVNARFRMPLVPFLIIFAVHGVKAFRESLHEGRRAKALVAVLIFLAMSAIGNTGFLDVEVDYISQSYRTIGYSYYERQDYDKAKEMFLRAYDIDPDHAANINSLGNIYYLEKDYKKALDFYQKSAFLYPERPEVHFNLGMTYEAMGRYSEAEKHYLVALKLAPDYERAREGLRNLWIKLGRIRPQEGQAR